MNALRLSRRRCPQCGWAITRIPRRPQDRTVGETPPIRRYRCCDAGGCGWEGALAVTWSDRGVEHRVRALARVRMTRMAKSRFVTSALLGLAGVALGAIGAQLYGAFGPVWFLTGSARTVPFGVSDFGRPLPGNHPFLQQAVETAAPPITTAAVATDWSAADTPAPSADHAPLALREGCAWGEPGRAPYKGTIQQALNGARLPADVVAVLERKIQAHETSDVVEIRNDKIRAVHGAAAFEPHAIKMTFAKTLCLNSRVNFKPGHVELADLYETRDARGVTYSVMVPYVCGNISVLGSRAALDEGPQSLPAPGAPGSLWAQRPEAPRSSGLQGVPSPLPFNTPFGTPFGTPFSTPVDVNSIPEPETWTLLLGSVALLGWFTRRRRRASAVADRQPDSSVGRDSR
jgi:hypothetical protein